MQQGGKCSRGVKTWQDQKRQDILSDVDSSCECVPSPWYDRALAAWALAASVAASVSAAHARRTRCSGVAFRRSGALLLAGCTAFPLRARCFQLLLVHGSGPRPWLKCSRCSLRFPPFDVLRRPALWLSLVHVAQSIGRAQTTKLWHIFYLVDGHPRRTNS